MKTATKQHAKRLRDDVERIRERVRTLQAEIMSVERAPIPRDESLQNLRDFIDSETQRYLRTVHVGPLIRPGRRPFDFDLLLAVVSATPTSSAEGWNRLVNSAFCAFAPDRVEAVLTERIDAALAENPPGLPTDQRGPRIAELRAELLKEELAEESAIRAAELESVAIDRRADADPAVVLGLDEAAA